MSIYNPFSEEQIEWIFERTNDKVKRRENTKLDFKENFHFNSLAEYGKFGASFANRGGGYLVFGIKDNPHLLLGMKEDAQFENLDPEKVTTIFNENFAPSLKWDSYLHEFDGKKFGIIYFYEASDKPVIALKGNNKGNFKEGNIYYRYSGQSKQIRYSELNDIIQNKIQKKQEDWFNFLKSAMQVKPESAFILDLNKGKIDVNEQPILIDESIVEKIKFIKEGQFSEKEGAPTLKLIGEISETAQKHDAKLIEKRIPTPTAITTENLYENFFSQDCSDALEYLKQFCYELIIYLPIWHFILCSKMSIDEVEAYWLSLNGVKEGTRRKLLSRLRSDEIGSCRIGTIIAIEDDINQLKADSFDDFAEKLRIKLGYGSNQEITIQRSLIYKYIMEDSGNNIPKEFAIRYPNILLEAISHLPIEVICERKEWLLDTLKNIGPSKLSSTDKNKYRKSVCSVDIKISKPKVE